MKCNDMKKDSVTVKFGFLKCSSLLRLIHVVYENTAAIRQFLSVMLGKMLGRKTKGHSKPKKNKKVIRNKEKKKAENNVSLLGGISERTSRLAESCTSEDAATTDEVQSWL